MRTIWKFVLDVPYDGQRVTSLGIPEGGQVLTAQVKDGEICIWVLVDPEAQRVLRRFVVWWTGFLFHLASWPIHYVATIQGAPLVYHVFEIIEPQHTSIAVAAKDITLTPEATKQLLSMKHPAPGPEPGEG